MSTKWLPAMALLAVPTVAQPAQSERSMLGYVGNATFFIDAPEGWGTDADAARRLNALFVLTPQGTTFNNSAAVIVGTFFPETTVIDAKGNVKASVKSRDPSAQFSEPDPVRAGNVTISLMEIRSRDIPTQPIEALAFVQLEKTVVMVTLSALSQDAFLRGRSVWLEMLKTYSEAGIKIKTGP